MSVNTSTKEVPLLFTSINPFLAREALSRRKDQASFYRTEN